MMKSKWIAIFLIIPFMAFMYKGVENRSVEDLSILSGIGMDIKKAGSQIIYIVSSNSDQYLGKEIFSETISGEGYSVGWTRPERQKKADKVISLGLERVYVIGEQCARNAMKQYINILFSNPALNDMGLCMVCNGKAEDLLKTKQEGVQEVSSFLEGLVARSRNYNFFSENYKLFDVYLRIGAEGRNLCLPYISVVNNKIQITGMAVFKGYNMVKVIPIKDVPTFNMLREPKSQGEISIIDGDKKYIDTYAKVVRHVKCKREKGKYNFTINLDINLEINSNTMIKDLNESTARVSDVENRIKQKIESESVQLIDTIKNEYKVDCLELGRYAAGKYGRHKGIDWNKELCNSNISVQANVKIDKLGRGNY